MEIVVYFFLVLTVLFLILWLSAREKLKSDDTVDVRNKTYGQGYWDGYRARQKEISEGKPPIDAVANEAPSEALQVVDTFNSDGSGFLTEDIEVNEAEQKTKNNLQNINTALYVASFLLVASAALFVGTALPESVRFAGVWAIVVLFYSVGLYLHGNVPTLRPAASAFVGTGLAVLPFTGIAMFNFVLPDSAICWFITSLIGVVAFAFAAFKLQSQVVAYFTIAFVISMVTSSVATIGAGLMWYFVVLIGFGSLMTFVSITKPNWIPSYFSKSIQQTNRWIVPLTLVASFFVVSNLSLSDYWVIALVSAFYYVTVAVSTKSSERDIALFMARLLASLAVAIFAFDITDSYMVTSMVVSVIGALQVTLSSVSLAKHSTRTITNNEAWLWIGFVLQILAPILLTGYMFWDSVVLFQLLLLVATSYCSSYMLRRVELASFGIFALALLPILVGLCVIKPELETQVIALIFIALSAIALSLRSVTNYNSSHPSVRPLFVTSYLIFTTEALLFTTGASFAVGSLVWLIAAALTYYLVYLVRKPDLLLVANFLFLVSTIWIMYLINVADLWKPLTLSWVILVCFYGSYLVLFNSSSRRYRDYFWWSAVVTAVFINLFILFILPSSSVLSDVTLMPITVIGLIIVALAMVSKGLKTHTYMLVDVGVILVTIGLQRLVSLSSPGLNMLVYTHWWAIAVAGLSYFYYGLGKGRESKTRAIIALCFVTFFTGIMALLPSYNLDNPPYQMIFLIEHILILLIGLVQSRKLFTMWGAVGVSLAIVWMLSGFTYLLLALAAFTLIGIAIYALAKQSKN